MAREIVRIGSKVPAFIMKNRMAAVCERTWTEYGTRVIDEKNVIKMFPNEEEFLEFMSQNHKRTFRTKNADGSVTHRTIKYMPRYEVVALASYDDNLKFQQMVFNPETHKFSPVPRAAKSQFITMSDKNINISKAVRQ